MKAKKFKWRKNTELPDDAVGDYVVTLSYICNRWLLHNGIFQKTRNYTKGNPEYGIYLDLKDKDPIILWRSVRKWCYEEELIDYIK